MVFVKLHFNVSHTRVVACEENSHEGVHFLLHYALGQLYKALMSIMELQYFLKLLKTLPEIHKLAFMIPKKITPVTWPTVIELQSFR